jgi:hypothetical protein
VAREPQRLRAAARIPDALLRPKAPSRERGSAGERTAAKKEMPSLQAGQFLM